MGIKQKMTITKTNLARAWSRALHALACNRNEISTSQGFLHSKSHTGRDLGVV